MLFWYIAYEKIPTMTTMITAHVSLFLDFLFIGLQLMFSDFSRIYTYISGNALRRFQNSDIIYLSIYALDPPPREGPSAVSSGRIGRWRGSEKCLRSSNITMTSPTPPHEEGKCMSNA